MIHIPGSVNESALDGEIVILDAATGNYYGLDETGSRIWELLKKYNEIESIVKAMLEEYEIDEKILRDDITKFLNALRSKGLVIIDEEIR